MILDGELTFRKNPNAVTALSQGKIGVLEFVHASIVKSRHIFKTAHHPGSWDKIVAARSGGKEPA